MDLDTRARRAADGVRASARGVDPMAQITELKREDKTRRRNISALGAVGVTVLVVGAGWFAMTQLGDDADSASPASTPTVSAAEIDLEPGPRVGTRMTPPMVARAPSSWTILANGASVMLELDGSDVTFEHVDIEGPIQQVFDPEQRTGVPLPPEGYANWLREHPRLLVLQDRMVVVDGDRFPQLTVRMADDAQGDEVPLAMTSNEAVPRPGWPDYSRGELVTLTVIEVDGETMVVSSAVELNSPEQAEVEAALDLVLSTMKLPN